MDGFQTLRLPGLSSMSPRLIKPLAAFGGIWASYQLYKAFHFTWLHFLRPGTLDRYRQGSKREAWALVTGASDGIGKGFAEELAHRGFNVVLHGRNEEKLSGIKDELQRRWPERRFKLLVLDAANDVNDAAKMQAAVDELKDLGLRVLINNVAGGAADGSLWSPLQEMSTRTVEAWIDATARFPAQLTRLLLPQLISQQPALILNIGSGVSEMAAPFLGVYSGCKAFNKSWSRSLAAELPGQGHDIEVLAILVGMVATERSKRPASVLGPSPRRMAKASLDVVGCGQRVVWAYWGHAIQFGGLLAMLPSSVIERLTLGIAKEGMDKERRGEVAL